MARYKNPWYKDEPLGGVQFYETDSKPTKHRGCLIYERIKGNCWDVVIDGECVAQRAGLRAAKEVADEIMDNY